MNQYTANSKKRACTRKAETAVKVSRMQAKAANDADKAIMYERHKEQRKADRMAMRQKKRELNK